MGNFINPEMEFKEFEPRFKSAKTRFKLSAGLNIETFNTIISGAPTIFKPQLKFFKFGQRLQPVADNCSGY